MMENKIPIIVVISMLLGILTGSLIQVKVPHVLVLAAIYTMLIPVMMNINLKELHFVFKENKFLLATIIVLNFLLFPIFSYIIYLIFRDFHLFIALMLLSLLPTGSMTLNFISLSKGDIHFGAIIQIISLTLGAILIVLTFPLLTNSSLSLLNTLEKVVITIVVPLVLAQILKPFLKVDKRVLKKISIIGMIMIIFLAGYLKSEFIVNIFSKNLVNFLGVILFYLISFVASYLISNKNPTLFYCLFLKNISIALGVSVLLFPESVIYLVICYLLQLPIASFSLRLLKKESASK